MLSLIISLFGCVKDGVDECPECPEAHVKINFFAEKFRNKYQDPLMEREEKFCDRVSHLRYYLYKDGELYSQGMIDSFSDPHSPGFLMEYSGLKYGNYTVVAVANCSGESLSGDPTKMNQLLLTYPGCETTEDYFTAVFPFTVDAPTSDEYNVGLLRAHGVIRYTFENMPSDISDIEIRMENVYGKKWIAGNYEEGTKVSRRYKMNTTGVKQSVEDYVIGTFPSIAGEKSAYYLNLYREGEITPYISQLISDTLTVTRNQLLEIAVKFNDGNLDFEIDLDSDWDGSHSDVETEL